MVSCGYSVAEQNIAPSNQVQINGLQKAVRFS